MMISNKTQITLSLAATLTLSTLALGAADWHQYRGSNGDGIAPEKISIKWPKEGPKQIWKVPTQTGFSSFTVAGGKAFIQVARDLQGSPREAVVAMDAATGKDLWKANIGIGTFQKGGDAGTPDNRGGDGPRSTPVTDGKCVYAYTQDLELFCLDVASGKKLWTLNVMRDHKGRNIGWKSAKSPLIEGDLVFVAGGGPGESILAVNKTTGKVVWKAFDEVITHATPVAATILGVRQVIWHMKSGLLAVSPKDGKELWRYAFLFKTATAVNPVVCGDIVFCSAGYGVGGAGVKISKAGAGLSAKEIWRVPGDKQVADLWSTPVYKEGFLYGMISYKEFGRGPLKCVDPKTGEVKWSQPGFGAGQVILADKYLIALADDGQVVLVEANPGQYKEIARFKAVEGKCWATPALSNGRLYVRSTREGACFDISAK